MDISKKRSFAVLAIAVICLMLIALAPSRADAATGANGAHVYSLNVNTTYSQFDVTGDGKQDVIRVIALGDSYMYERIAVYINGSELLSRDTGFFVATVKLVKLKNGAAFLYLFTPRESDDADICALYQIKSGGLRKVIDCNKRFRKVYGRHFGGSVVKASGNTLVMRFSIMAFMSGITYADYSYKFRSGTLKQAGNTGKLKVKSTSGKSHKARKQIAVYRNTKCKIMKFRVKKGHKVQFLKIYMKGGVVRYKIKSGSRTGWIKVANNYKSGLLYRHEYYPGSYEYLPPFAGTVIGG